MTDSSLNTRPEDDRGDSATTAPACRPRFSRAVWAALAFTLVYMGVALTASLRGRSTEFLMYLVVMSVLLAVVGMVHLRVGLHVAAQWGLSLWGLAHMAGGLMPVPASWPVGGNSRVLYNL